MSIQITDKISNVNMKNITITRKTAALRLGLGVSTLSRTLTATSNGRVINLST